MEQSGAGGGGGGHRSQTQNEPHGSRPKLCTRHLVKNWSNQAGGRVY